MRCEILGTTSSKVMMPLECAELILNNLKNTRYEYLLLLHDALIKECVDGAKYIGEIKRETYIGGEEHDLRYDKSYRIYDVAGKVFGIAKIKSKEQWLDKNGKPFHYDEIQIVDVREKIVEVKKYEVVEE